MGSASGGCRRTPPSHSVTTLLLLSALLASAAPAAGAFATTPRPPAVPKTRLAKRYNFDSVTRRLFVPPSSRRLMALKRTDEVDADAAAEVTPSLVSYAPLVLPLLLVYISNQWSRSSLYYLVNFSAADVNPTKAMNVDLNFSEAQYGLLASVAFTALFAVASLLAGNLSDRADRKLLTAGSAVAWSVATLATAASGGYGQVLTARVLMGLACAFTTPAAYTLIRDVVPAERTALANSVYGSGVYLGGALASLSILLDDNLGWRGALGIIGVYGLVSAALAVVFLPSDPKFDQKEEIRSSGGGTEDRGAIAARGEAGPGGIGQKQGKVEENAASMTLLTDARDVISTSRVQWLFLASFLRFCSGLCIGVWSAPYFRLAFPDDSTSYAVVNAFIVGLCGVTSGVLGGFLSDKAGAAAVRRGLEENVGRLAVPVVGSVLAVPTWWLTVHASTFELAMFWLAVEYLVAECWFGPVVAVLQSSVGPGRGGTAQGMFTLTGAVGNLAPSILGLLYGQATAAGVEEGAALSSLLGSIVCAGYLLSALCFFVSSQASNDNTDDGARSLKTS